MTKKQTKTRARNAKDKETRKNLILTAGFELFKTMDLDQISMDLIAKKSKLAKGTLYLYFKTKEEVFLTLLNQKLSEWISAVQMEFGNIPHPLPAREFAETFARSLSFAPELSRLLSLAHCILENNISEHEALQYKLSLKSQMEDAANAISHKTPALTSETALPFLMKSYSVLIGLYQMSHPNAMMEKILRNPELEIFRMNFEEELTATLFMILAGMESIETQKSKSFHLFENY